jgi:diacylglycerol kinase family enzyme
MERFLAAGGVWGGREPKFLQPMSKPLMPRSFTPPPSSFHRSPVSSPARGRSKWLAVAQAATLLFQQSRTLRVELDGDSAHQSHETPFVFVGNNPYTVAGLEIGTRAALDGGKLWVCTAPYAGRLGLLALAVQALLGLVHDADLAAFETDETDVRMHRTHVQV